MKKVIVGVICLASMHVGAALAAQPVSMDKLKTGILAANQTYTIYQVTCSNSAEIAIASLQRGTRWCLDKEGELDCYKLRSDAAEKACLASSLAYNDAMDVQGAATD